MKLNLTSPIVSVTWLATNSNAENLVVLDASIQKIGTTKDSSKEKQQIPSAVFFDLKQVFLDKTGEFPNTIPTAKHFQEQVQNLGINKDSAIVIYDDLGVYSSPRAWWLFKVFGFDNVAVLNGGLPAWMAAENAVGIPKGEKRNKGNFEANYNKNAVRFTEEVLKATQSNTCILDARSEDRFYARVPEPRADMRGGHIPNAKSLAYTNLQKNGFMKSKQELEQLFSALNKENNPVIFTCGSGITACILALGAAICEIDNYAVYDGSWTAWASTLSLPVEK